MIESNAMTEAIEPGHFKDVHLKRVETRNSIEVSVILN